MRLNLFQVLADDTIQTVQDRFSKSYPSMQISFFRMTGKAIGTSQCILYSSEAKINEINPALKDFDVVITSNMRISELEKIIRAFGLYVQISCKMINRIFPGNSVSAWYLKDLFQKDTPQFFHEEKMRSPHTRWHFHLS